MRMNFAGPSFLNWMMDLLASALLGMDGFAGFGVLSSYLQLNFILVEEGKTLDWRWC